MGKGTVLIVDDDPDLRDMLELLLRDEDYDICMAKDGQGALDLIPILPEPAVILLDFHMPKLNGEGVLRHLAKHPEKRHDHPIYLLTADVSRLTPEMLYLLGSEGIPVLPKPFNLDALLDEVSGAFLRVARELP